MSDDKKTGRPRMTVVDSTRAGNQPQSSPWWGGWPLVATTIFTAALITTTGLVIGHFWNRGTKRFVQQAPTPVAPPPPQVVYIKEEGERLPHPMTGRFDEGIRSSRESATSKLDEDLRKRLEQQDKQLRALKRRLDELEEG